MTFYECLGKCSIEEMADYIIAMQFRSNVLFEEFSRSEEYKETKKLMIEVLNTEVH